MCEVVCVCTTLPPPHSFQHLYFPSPGNAAHHFGILRRQNFYLLPQLFAHISLCLRVRRPPVRPSVSVQHFVVTKFSRFLCAKTLIQRAIYKSYAKVRS